MTHRNHPQRRGTIFVLALAVTGFLSPAQAAGGFPPLFPFLISYDGPDNASSVAHLLDALAGKQGTDPASVEGISSDQNCNRQRKTQQYQARARIGDAALGYLESEGHFHKEL